MAAVINLSRYYISLIIIVLLSTTMLCDAVTQSTSQQNNGTQQAQTSVPPTMETSTSISTTTTPKSCDGDPAEIENGNFTINGKTVNSTASYWCNEGYQLNENVSVTCQADGTWQKPNANCTIKHCSTPHNITHGTVNYTNTTVNSTAVYRCDTGYQLNGTANVTCQANGRWSVLLENCTVIVRAYNETCEDSVQCSTHNASCRPFDEKYTCRCSEDYYYHQGNNSCLKRIAYQQFCTLNGTKEQCKTVNASCLKDGWCFCEEDDYHDLENDSCKPSIAYQQSCTLNGTKEQCKTVNASCLKDGWCFCDEDDYYDSNSDSCISRPVAPKDLELLIDYNSVETDSLYVEWTSADDNHIGKYTSILEWEPPAENNESHFEKIWVNIANHITVENLRSGTNYTFYLYLYLNYTGHRTKLLSTASAYTKPLPIETLHFDYIGERNTTIEWWNDPGRPCTSYEVSINGQADTVQRVGNTSKYSFNDLIGGNNYHFDITSIVPGHKSEPFTQRFNTRPKPVTSAKMMQVRPDSLTVQLVIEDKEEGESYRLYVYPKTSVENKTVTSDNETLKISGLEPGTLYTVQIYTYYQSLESERFWTIMEYTRPLSPENLTATKILEGSLELHWAMADSMFDEYILEYSTLDYTGSITINISNTTIQNYPIRNLTSGTGYSFRLYSAVNGTKSLEPAVYEVYTKPSGPNKPILTQRMDTSISIQLPDDNNSYTSYQIDGQLYDRNNGYITIENLTPGQYHTFTIFTVANYTELSLNNRTFKAFTLPGPPTNITFPEEFLHETNLTVEWENVMEGNVDGYVVHFSGGDSIEEYNDTSLANLVEFSNLTAGVRYNVTIYSIWNGELSCRTLEGYNYTRPPAPEVAIIDVTEMTLTLNITDKLWEGYRIIVNPGVQNNTDQLEFMSEKLPYEIKDLMAGTKYTLEIYSMIGGIVGENGDQISSYTKPDRVSYDTIQEDENRTTNNSLAFTWEKPDTGLVDWYELDIMCTSPNEPENLMLNFTRNTTETKALVWGLEPGTFCTVNITTHVGGQTGATTQKKVEWSTDEMVPEQVQDMNIETKARSLKLSWGKPRKPNGIIRKYAIDVIDEKQNCSFSRTIFTCDNCLNTSDQSCGEDSATDPWTIASCNESSPVYNRTFEDTDSLDYNVTELHPYRNYRVVVTPFSRCFGQQSSLSNRTEQDVPSGAPTSVEQDLSRTTADSLSISWMPPEEDRQNGVITQYTVYYKYKNRTCFGDETGSEIMENFNVSSISGANILTLDRYPFWPYEVTISAWTIIGEGPKTESLTVMTNESTPDAVRSPPTVANISQFTIELHWETPCFVNGIIDHYRIQVFNDRSEVVKNFNTTSNDTLQNIDGLYPYHNYTVSVSAVNMGGQEGPAVNTTEVARTKTGVPYKPMDVKAKAKSSTSIQVNWQTPELYTGVTRYNVTVKDTQDSLQYATLSGWNFYQVEMDIGGLDAYWNYTVTVTAVTSAGHNVSEESSVVRTHEAAPGNIGSLSLATEHNVTKPRSIEVNWTDPKPRDLNGILTSFYVTYIPSGVSQTHSPALTRKVEVERKSFIIHNIVPGSYNVSVYASTKAGNGSKFMKNITVPPGAPIIVEESANDPLLKESSTSSPSETQIPIQLPIKFLCDQKNGIPKYFGLIVAADSQATDTPFLGNRDDFDVRHKTYKTWFEINGMEKPQPYITTATDWNPCKKRRKRSTDSQSESFTIGTQGDCSGVAPGTYCNGELKPGTSYRVKAFSCTDGGCAETMYSKVIKTEEPINLVIPIVGGVVAAVVVSAVAIGTVIYLRRRQAACFAKSAEDGFTHRRSEPIQATELAERNSSSRVFSPCQVRLSEFPEYVEKLKKDSGLQFSEAYKMIKENSPQHQMSIAESQICRPKNRYTNILPFDHSRVKLLPLDDEEGTDYINANYIPGYTSRREYIATQGPMPSTFDDFWRMVWEQNVEIIVMLTKLVEKGRNKCDKYWPNQNEPQFYGDLSVSVMSESNLSDYTIRIMELKLTGEKRTVKQFSFLKWPDMGCPEYPDLLLDFVKSVQQLKSTSSEKRPMVVHCSAGVGRTGTFIAVDHLLQHIRDHDELDIYNLVLEMRNNRCNMVQTEDQYIYIHECIREFISNDDQEDEDDDDDEHIYTNTQQENVYENTGFARPF